VRILAWLLALPFVVTGASAQRTEVRHMRWDGLDRTWLMRAPRVSDSARALPLVIALHGRGSNATRMLQYTGFEAMADAEGFLLVAPEGTGDPRGWYTGFSLGDEIDDVGFVGAVIDSVAQRYAVDRSRVYVTGHSNGAVLAHRVAADLSSRIAAVAVVAGAVGARGNDGVVRRIEFPRAPVPILILHGDADDIVPYDTTERPRARPVPAPDGARFWARANECGVLVPRRDSIADGRVLRDTWSDRCQAPVVFITVRGGGHGWPRGQPIDATETIWRFFREHTR
jgi:polyhydroxybutyrate depolymerase